MRSLSERAKTKRPPLWAGPSGEGPNGGVTQGLIARWLSCKERFRLLAVEGLKARERFSHRLHYGQMWHICEEALAKVGRPKSLADTESIFRPKLGEYCRSLQSQYQTDKVEVEKWYNVCLRQFPLYVQYWSQHPDVTNRTPLLSEVAFDVPYNLPSGRTIRLRGKWDSVDLVGKGKDAAIWLQENKTKGDIDEPLLKAQLGSGFELQTMLYLTALQSWEDDNTHNGVFIGEAAGKGFEVGKGAKIAGVRYNVIRRPLSGGKGTIVQKKESKNVPAETENEYYDRLAQYIKDDPAYFFMRWNVGITAGDIARFRRECLDPMLEALCNWWTFTTEGSVEAKYVSSYGLHWRTPYGVWNPLEDGGSSEYDNHLADGMEVGLDRVTVMFPELA